MAALEKEGEAATMIQQPADGGVELEPEEEGEREVRERRDGETRAELKQIQKLRKVSHPLDTHPDSQPLDTHPDGLFLLSEVFLVVLFGGTAN